MCWRETKVVFKWILSRLNSFGLTVEEKQKLYLNLFQVTRGYFADPVEEKQKLYLNGESNNSNYYTKALKRNKSCI